MRLSVVGSALALLMVATLSGSTETVSHLPLGRSGSYRVEAQIVSRGESGGTIRLPSGATHSVMGDLPPVGSRANLTVRSTPTGFAVQSVQDQWIPSRFDLGGNPPLTNHPNAPGTSRVVGQLTNRGIRVGRSTRNIAHDGSSGQWVLAELNNDTNTLRIIEVLSSTHGTLAGMPTRTNNPTHTERGIWR